MKIRIIGGGIYGCHVALALLATGRDVTLFEKSDRLFAGASGNNQSRLHLGFHYPRCAKTRAASISGYQEFLKIYPSLSRPIRCNIYAIASSSLIDFETYRLVMQGSGAPFFQIDHNGFGLANVEGAVQCPERLVLADDARAFFTAALAGRVVFNTTVTRDFTDRRFAATVDCTFGAFGSEEIDIYEPCIMHLYDGPEEIAITVMDGPFASIYPYFDGGVSLTSVDQTPLASCKSYGAAQDIIDRLTDDRIAENRNAMEKVITAYVPWFHERWRWRGYVTAIRGVPPSRADSRRCIVLKTADDTIMVQPGKMDAIFSAARRVAELLPKE